MIKRVISVVLCVFLLMLSLTACSEDKFVPSQKPFDKKIQSQVLPSGEVVADNGELSLVYDADYATVQLCDKNGNTWSICKTPAEINKVDELGMKLKPGSLPQSAIEVGYMDERINGGGNGVADTFTKVLDDYGRIVCKKIDNGVTIEYYFDNEEFMVPVDYVLKDDYLSISVDTKRIQENQLKITYVSLAPFICSVENDTKNSYLFYPSGSGALLDTKTVNTQGFRYSAYVYGDDLTMEEEYSATNETSIRMPVYGYSVGTQGGFAIIDQGADAVLLNSVSGGETNLYSAVYPSFQLRGYTAHKAQTFSNSYTTKIYPTNMLEGTFSIRFYPLEGKEKANYTEMANIYRNYLVTEKGLKETNDDTALSVNLLGGTMITKSFLGIPYQTLYSTTSIDDANKIITELSDSVDNLSVKLKGFGETGIDIGQIGGGFNVGGSIGSAGDLKKLSKLCKDKKVDLYMDYDLVRFSSSGSGFSNFNDVVMNSGYIRSDQFIFDKAMRNNEEDLSYRLLRPIRFNDAVTKALEQNADFELTGISFDTLSSQSYSDYSDYNKTIAYNAKYGFGDAVTKAVAQIKSNKQKYMASSANVYAALAADIISETPVSSDNGYAFMEDVPFYAMVFKGYKPMTSEAINNAANTNKTVFAAIEGGIGLNYDLISNWDNVLIDALYPELNTSVYSNIKDNMLSTYNKYADYYESIKGAKIIKNTAEDGVHYTEFDNGVKVYINYNSGAAYTNEIGMMEPNSCEMFYNGGWHN